MKIDVTLSTETSISAYKTARFHSPQDHSFSDLLQRFASIRNLTREKWSNNSANFIKTVICFRKTTWLPLVVHLSLSQLESTSMDQVTASNWREILPPYLHLRTKSELEIELDVRQLGRWGTEQEHGECLSVTVSGLEWRFLLWSWVMTPCSLESRCVGMSP